MTPAEWIALIGIVSAGATGLFLANRRTIETLVGKRLDGLQAAVAALTVSATDHGQQLVRHETIFEMNGLIERRVKGGR